MELPDNYNHICLAGDFNILGANYLDFIVTDKNEFFDIVAEPPDIAWGFWRKIF